MTPFPSLQSWRSGQGLLVLALGMGGIWLVGYALLGQLGMAEELRFGWQRTLARASLLVALLAIAWMTWPQWSRLPGLVRRKAIDLALFRILLFGFLAIGALFQERSLGTQALAFVDLPTAAVVPPAWMAWLPKVMPFDKVLVHIADAGFYLAIVAVLMGFRTRAFLWVYVLCLFYLLAIPNFFGKVNHNHHLLWFPMILAASPCADTFSVDAWLRKRRGKTVNRPPSAYTWPFLAIWILMGIIYFFPGFWKLWTCGLDWALTDNLQHHMHYKWMQLGEWEPFFRIDQYPVLYRGTGLLTLVFELFFLPMILFRWSRPLAIVMGLAFHLGALLFMNIFFVVLVLSYLSFIRWSGMPWWPRQDSQVEELPDTGPAPMLKWVMGILIAGNLLFGFGRWYSWPFTVYPTFDSFVPVTVLRLKYYQVEESGIRSELDPTVLRATYSSERYRTLEAAYAEAYAQGNAASQQQVLEQFAEAIRADQAGGKGCVEVWLEEVKTAPESREWGEDVARVLDYCGE